MQMDPRGKIKNGKTHYPKNQLIIKKGAVQGKNNQKRNRSDCQNKKQSFKIQSSFHYPALFIASFSPFTSSSDKVCFFISSSNPLGQKGKATDTFSARSHPASFLAC